MLVIGFEFGLFVCMVLGIIWVVVLFLIMLGLDKLFCDDYYDGILE